MGLEHHLYDLLYEHDCVIVPGWGGFLAQYRPARLDETRRVVHPPGKEVGFNRHLLRNDGLLMDRLAQRDGLVFAEANAVIADEVGSWRSRLDRSGRLELQRIGIFYRDAEGNLQFEPDTRANFLKEAYGLRPIPAIPIAHAEEVPVLPIAPVPVPEPVVGRPWKWVAAAGVAVLLCAGTIATYLLIQGTQEGSFAQWMSRPEPTYRPAPMPVPAPTASASVFALPEEPLGIRTLPLTDNDSVTLTVDLGTPATLAVADTTAVAVPSARPERARFHVIGGCFAQPENAERLLQDLRERGYPAQRLPRYGELHPVAFGSYPDRTTALQALASIRVDGSAQAWLLVR